MNLRVSPSCHLVSNPAVLVCSGALRFDRGAPALAALLDHAADPHQPAAFASPPAAARLHSFSFLDRNAEVLGPAPPEIHVYVGPAFAYGGHLALRQREPASPRANTSVEAAAASTS